MHKIRSECGVGGKERKDGKHYTGLPLSCKSCEGPNFDMIVWTS